MKLAIKALNWHNNDKNEDKTSFLTFLIDRVFGANLLSFKNKPTWLMDATWDFYFHMWWFR
jgi:hypothetical protein